MNNDFRQIVQGNVLPEKVLTSWERSKNEESSFQFFADRQYEFDTVMRRAFICRDNDVAVAVSIIMSADNLEDALDILKSSHTWLRTMKAYPNYVKPLLTSWYTGEEPERRKMANKMTTIFRIFDFTREF